MRYIDLNSFIPSAEWQTKSRNASDQLEKLATSDERLEYIKSHSQIWRELAQELRAHFGTRCWFTDADDLSARLDVEHFRPKAKALDEDGTIHEGYWWLAFDYSNLRLAGQILNREHKRNYFPLLANSIRANSADRRWQEELPAFIDPTKIEDVVLVSYNETGAICPSQFADTPERLHRVMITDRLFGLSSWQPLFEARQSIWSECVGHISAVERLISEENQFSTSPRTKALMGEHMAQLQRLTRSETPLFAVARSCLAASGHPWALRILSIG